MPARRVAVGNAAGLREEWEPSRAKDVYDRIALPLAGEGAWISVHGVERPRLGPGQAAASRGLIVRAWRAVLDGKPAPPHVSTFCTEWGKDNHRTSVELAPPAGLIGLRPGDFVEAELELVVFPSDASVYYGPDAAFREALARDADSWRLVHREAAGQCAAVTARHGTVARAYPLTIVVDDQQRAEVKVERTLGHVPVTFTGLIHPRDHLIRVNGQALTHWQTDWDPATRRWQITCIVAASDAGNLHIQFQATPRK